MNRSDEQQQIDLVLSALRSAETPHDLEKDVVARLHRIMNAAEAIPHGEGNASRWRLPRLPFLVPAGALALVVTVCTVYRMGKPVRIKPEISSTRSTASPAVPARTQEGPARPQERTSAPSFGVTADRRAVRHPKHAPARGLHDDYPAPVAPLTAQEKILLGIAERADPVEVASLESNTPGAKDLESQMEFEKFARGGKQ